MDCYRCLIQWGVNRTNGIYSFPIPFTEALCCFGGGEAGSGGGRGGLDPPGWADRREIVVRKMGENEKKA